MDLIDKVKNKIFKSYADVSVEYHAGGFFVRKHALYLVFKANDTVFFLEREEGLHPDDNKYDLLVKILETDNGQYQMGKVSAMTNNILQISSKDNKDNMRLMPSIFIEGVVQNDWSEILLDKRNGEVILYNHVYTIAETN